MILRLLQLPNGEWIEAEIVSTPESRRRGLSGRSQLPDGTGMLFLFDECGQHPFWMADTRFPLDIVWMNHQGRVVEIALNARPFSVRKLGGKRLSSMALEIGAGTAKRTGIRIGCQIP